MVLEDEDEEDEEEEGFLLFDDGLVLPEEDGLDEEGFLFVFEVYFLEVVESKASCTGTHAEANTTAAMTNNNLLRIFFIIKELFGYKVIRFQDIHANCLPNAESPTAD